MATLILETGAGLINSNSYADLAFADDYFESHPYHADAWAEITDENRREALLMAGSQFLDSSFEWEGYRATTEQAMAWPRTHVYFDEQYLYPEFTVPDVVRKAACEQAFFMSKGDPAVPLPGVGITDLKIDVIELSFDKAVRPSTVPTSVGTLLRGLGNYVFGRRIRKVIVG